VSSLSFSSLSLGWDKKNKPVLQPQQQMTNDPWQIKRDKEGVLIFQPVLILSGRKVTCVKVKTSLARGPSYWGG
jgi:hypothetical protein